MQRQARKPTRNDWPSRIRSSFVFHTGISSYRWHLSPWAHEMVPPNRRFMYETMVVSNILTMYLLPTTIKYERKDLNKKIRTLAWCNFYSLFISVSTRRLLEEKLFLFRTFRYLRIFLPWSGKVPPGGEKRWGKLCFHFARVVTAKITGFSVESEVIVFPGALSLSHVIFPMTERKTRLNTRNRGTRRYTFVFLS